MVQSSPSAALTDLDLEKLLLLEPRNVLFMPDFLSLSSHRHVSNAADGKYTTMAQTEYKRRGKRHGTGYIAVNALMVHRL